MTWTGNMRMTPLHSPGSVPQHPQPLPSPPLGQHLQRLTPEPPFLTLHRHGPSSPSVAGRWGGHRPKVSVSSALLTLTLLPRLHRQECSVHPVAQRVVQGACHPIPFIRLQRTQAYYPELVLNSSLRPIHSCPPLWLSSHRSAARFYKSQSFPTGLKASDIKRWETGRTA